MRAGIDLDLASLLQLKAYARPIAHKVQQGLSGQHHSRRGRGLIFDQVRRYQTGDDARSIDWRVTARTGHLHTRVLCEERQHPLHLFIDLRASMFFGSRHCLKAHLLMQLAAVLGFRGELQQDPVKVSLLTSEALSLLASGKGPQDWRHALAQLQQHYQQQLHQPGTGNPPLSSLLSGLQRRDKAPTLSIILSDWHDLTEADLPPLQALARRHPLWLIGIHDPFDAELPEIDLWFSQGSNQQFISARDRACRQQWRQAYQQRQQLWQQLAASSGIRCVQCSTSQPLTSHLHALGQEL